ncbi:MAG: hypothetical protein ACFFE2_16015 [Candidatus Thorarchaeota archaeon]
MPDDVIEIRNITKRGGSLALNIPSVVAKQMNLTAGCSVVFQYEIENNRIVIEKVESINTEKGRKIELPNSGCD